MATSGSPWGEGCCGTETDRVSRRLLGSEPNRLSDGISMWMSCGARRGAAPSTHSICPGTVANKTQAMPPIHHPIAAARNRAGILSAGCEMFRSSMIREKRLYDTPMVHQYHGVGGRPNQMRKSPYAAGEVAVP